MLYATGSNIYCIGGIPVGPTASAEPPPPPPSSKDLTLWVMATGNGSASASAYVNGTGSPVAVWSAHGGSASASVTIGSSDKIAVVTEVPRPNGYSSNISASGFYSTSNPEFTTSKTVRATGSADYSVDSAYMVGNYSAGKFIVTGGGVGGYELRDASISGLNSSVIYESFPYMSDMFMPDSESARPESILAFKTLPSTSYGEPNPWYSSRRTYLNMSAFSSIRVSAEAYIKSTMSNNANSRVYANLEQFDMHGWSTEIGYKTIYSSTSDWYGFSGAASTSHGNEPPEFSVAVHDGASATVYNNRWWFSGVLK